MLQCPPVNWNYFFSWLIIHEGLGASFYSFVITLLFLSCVSCCLRGRGTSPIGICYLIVNAKRKVMLLVFHVRLTLLVNTGPRVHFVAVLHDSSVQSGSVEICAVFLRRETKHLRRLSGEYPRAWHSPLVPNDIWITMLQNIYINKSLGPINSPPTAQPNIGSYQGTVCTPCPHPLCMCLHRPPTHRAGRKIMFLPMWNFWPSVWVQCSMTTAQHVQKMEYSGVRETVWPTAALSAGWKAETTCSGTRAQLGFFIGY